MRLYYQLFVHELKLQKVKNVPKHLAHLFKSYLILFVITKFYSLI